MPFTCFQVLARRARHRGKNWNRMLDRSTPLVFGLSEVPHPVPVEARAIEPSLRRLPLFHGFLFEFVFDAKSELGTIRASSNVMQSAPGHRRASL
jgi:hypothetical protein